MYMYMYVYVCMHACMDVCMYVCMYLCVCMRAYIHVDMGLNDVCHPPWKLGGGPAGILWSRECPAKEQQFWLGSRIKGLGI